MDNKRTQVILIVIGLIAAIVLVSMIARGPIQQAQENREFRKSLAEWDKLPQEEQFRRMGGEAPSTIPGQPAPPPAPVSP